MNSNSHFKFRFYVGLNLLFKPGGNDFPANQSRRPTWPEIPRENTELEARTQTLESFQVSTSKDINDLKESLNFTEEKYKSKLESVDKGYKNINLKFTNLEKENQEVNDKINELETKRLYLEAYSH